MRRSQPGRRKEHQAEGGRHTGLGGTLEESQGKRAGDEVTAWQEP